MSTHVKAAFFLLKKMRWTYYSAHLIVFSVKVLAYFSMYFWPLTT